MVVSQKNIEKSHRRLFYFGKTSEKVANDYCLQIKHWKKLFRLFHPSPRSSVWYNLCFMSNTGRVFVWQHFLDSLHSVASPDLGWAKRPAYSHCAVRSAVWDANWRYPIENIASTREINPLTKDFFLASSPKVILVYKQTNEWADGQRVEGS